jgi:hypothetical protein
VKESLITYYFPLLDETYEIRTDFNYSDRYRIWVNRGLGPWESFSTFEAAQAQIEKQVILCHRIEHTKLTCKLANCTRETREIEERGLGKFVKGS